MRRLNHHSEESAGTRTGLLRPASDRSGLISIPTSVERLATEAVNAASDVHKEFGPGLTDSAYETAFVHELGLRGIACRRQVDVPTIYKGTPIELGFLINFNDILIKQGIQRVINASYTPS